MCMRTGSSVPSNPSMANPASSNPLQATSMVLEASCLLGPNSTDSHVPNTDAAVRLGEFGGWLGECFGHCPHLDFDDA